jgi:hypothetical protein
VKGLFGLFSRKDKGSSAVEEPAGDETPTGRIPVLTAEPDVEPGAYPNSARPLPDGGAPAPEFTIKGNAGSMLFHTKESPYFGRTKAEVWFRTPQDAETAGFTAWDKRRRA